MEFLKSNRFWALVLIAVAGYLQSVGFTFNAYALGEALQVIAGGHIAVKTIDRGTEVLSKQKKVA